jgi:ubiquitin carboxyl-terminal hydrolase 36/42
VLPAFLEQAPPPPPPPKTAQSVAAPVVPTRLDEASGRYDARPPAASGEEGKRGCAFLEAFTSPELLAGADRYRCGKCNARRRASKQLLLGPRLPRVLAVHFKRFGQDASGNLFKIARAVEGLTSEIEVGGYCVAPPEVGATTRYRLRGMVVHSGTSLRQGHYIAYCSYGAEGKWVMISDTNVRPSSLGEALSSEAYIAFYSQE